MARDPYKVEKDGIEYWLPLSRDAKRAQEASEIYKRHQDRVRKQVPTQRSIVAVQQQLAESAQPSWDDIVTQTDAAYPGLLESDERAFDNKAMEMYREQLEVARRQSMSSIDAEKQQQRLVSTASRPFEEILPSGEQRERIRAGEAAPPPRAPNLLTPSAVENVTGEEQSIWGSVKELAKKAFNLGNYATIPLNVESVVNIGPVASLKAAEKIRANTPVGLSDYLQLSKELEEYEKSAYTQKPKEIPAMAAGRDYVPMDVTVHTKAQPKKFTAGVPQETWLREGDEAARSEIVRATKQTLGTGFFGEGQYSDELLKAKEGIRRNAEMIFEEMRQLDPEIDPDMADVIYEDLLKADTMAAAMNSPNAAQMIPEIAAGIIMPWGPAIKGGKATVRGAASLAKKIPKIGRAVEAVDSVAKKAEDLYRAGFDPNAISRPEKISGVAPEVAERLSDVQMAGRSKYYASMDRVREYASRLENLSEELSDEGVKLYAELDSANSPRAVRKILSEASPDDAAILSEIDTLAKDYFEFKKQMGVGLQEGEAGVVEAVDALDYYMPRYVRGLNKTDVGADVTAIRPKGYDTDLYVDPAAAHARTADSRKATGAINDPKVQWRAAGNIEGRQTAMSSVIQDLAPAYAKEGLVYADDVAGLPATVKKLSPEEGTNLLDSLKTGTGMDWVQLGPHDSAAWRKALVGEGGPVSNANLFVPRQAYDYMRSLPAAAPALKDDFAKGITKATQAYMRLWKGSKTLGNLMGFVMTNLHGSSQLLFANKGAAAFHPEIQLPAIEIAIEGAFKGTYKGLKGAATLASGEKVSTSALAKLMMDYGVIKQGGARLGRDPLKKLGILEKGADVARITDLVSATDDWYHASAFLASLKSTHPADVVKAVRVANEVSGNYRMLTPFEKSIRDNLIPFYGFQGWALKNVTKQTLTDPGHMIRLGNVYQSYEKETAAQTPIGYEARPDYMQGFITSANQPEDESLGFVTTRTSPPWEAVSAFGVGSPLTNWLAGVASGIDPTTGHPNEEFTIVVNKMLRTLADSGGTPEQIRQALYEGTKNPHIKAILDPILTPSMNALNLHQVYIREYGQGAAVDMSANLAVNRLFAGFNAIIDTVIGREAPVPAVPGLGGQYVGQPERTIDQRARVR